MLPFGPVITRHSEKNGLIQAQRTLFGWRVTVNQYDESSPYMNGLWRTSLRRVPKTAKIQRILFLGFGTGGNIKRLRDRFPEAQITSVEWDPEMIQLSKELGMYPKDEKLEVKVGDAARVVQELEGQYDLILFDLYHGCKTMCADHPLFMQRLADLLSPKGYLIFNAFKQPELFAIADACMSREKSWRYWYNHIALYRPFSMGLIGAPLPKGYQNFRTILPHIEREARNKTRTVIPGPRGTFGVRFKMLFWTESYMQDEEPVIDMDHGPSRLIMWQPITRQIMPKGWWRPWIKMHMNRTGFAEITRPEAYWKDWESHAQRHRTKWMKEQDIEIVETDSETFAVAYDTWSKFWFLKSLYVDMIRRKHVYHGDRFHTIFARRKSTGEIIAGFGYLDIPEASQSVHVISFIRKGKSNGSSVGVGLMDEWYKHAVKNNIRFLDFDLFWAPGESPTWKGFSRFKGQFVTRYIDWPRPFLKIVRKKK